MYFGDGNFPLNYLFDDILYFLKVFFLFKFWMSWTNSHCFFLFSILYPLIFSQNVLNFVFEFFLLIFHVCHHNFNFQELLFASMFLLYSP